MAINSVGDSESTKKIRILVQKIHASSPLKDSVYEEAADYFSKLPEMEQQLATLQQGLAAAELSLSTNTKSDRATKLKERVKRCEQKISLYNTELEQGRLARLHKLKAICSEILAFCEGKDDADSNNKFAKTLGTLLLNAPTEKKQALLYNQKAKHLYQAVLTLKLLEQLLIDRRISSKYILARANELTDDANDSFRNEVKIPLLMIVLLHDVGSYHPDAQKILKGEAGDLNEFRLLENDERLVYLKIQFHQLDTYLTHGLGLDKYTGNSKVERDPFNDCEQQKLTFMRLLLQRSIKPEQGIGNLLKIPQIYTSVVLSTKLSFTYSSLPRVFLLLNKAAERGSHSQSMVDSLLKITGIFPLGFGITYIPKDSTNRDVDSYEFAIVNKLYPENPHHPICRVATKKLVFNARGVNHAIAPENNLYYKEARTKLEKVSSERLRKILDKLWANFEKRHAEEELVPRSWHPYEYFSYIGYQNLWSGPVVLN